MPWFEAGDGGQVLDWGCSSLFYKKCLETNDETTRTHHVSLCTSELRYERTAWGMLGTTENSPVVKLMKFIFRGCPKLSILIKAFLRNMISSINRSIPNSLS